MVDKANYYHTPVFQINDAIKYAVNPYEAINKQVQNESKINESDKTVITCAHCDLTFIDNNEYEHHNGEMHGKKLICCELCDATFKRQDHLKRHIQTLHNQKYTICPVCNKDYGRQDVLQQHIKRIHSTTSESEVFHCRECDFQCNSLALLDQHEVKHSVIDRHNCLHCERTFKRRDHMLRHVKSHHLNQFFSCPICKQNYKRKDHLVRHVREKHRMGLVNGMLVTSDELMAVK